MNLHDVVSTTFINILSHQSITELRQILTGLDADEQIIITDEDEAKYYLYKTSELLDKVKEADVNRSIKQVLHQFRCTPTPAFETTNPIQHIPDKAIALHNGDLIGFLDISTAPENNETRNPIRNEVAASIKEANEGKHLFFINAYCNNKAVLNEEFTVRVNLENYASGIASLPAALEINSEIDIIIATKKGFRVVGKDHHTIRVVAYEDSMSVLFKLNPTVAGEGIIRIFAYSEGMEIGHIDLNIEIDQENKDVKGFQVSSPACLVEHYSLPDLILQISESEVGGKAALLFRLTTSEKIDYPRIYLKPYGPYKLRCNPATWFNEFFSEIEMLPKLTDSKAALKKIEDKGHELFNEILPEEVRKILWSLRNKIKSLKIDSDEPWIPWELLKLTGVENDISEEGPFFCEAFEITRWIPGHGAPKSKISLEKMALVVPSASNLVFTQDEKVKLEELLTSAGNTVEMVTPRLQSIGEAFQQNFTAWHFSGHGSFADVNNQNSSRIILDKSDTLTPNFIYGKNANMGKNHPMVFLNACQLGKSGIGLTGIGGWAPRFLSVGASVFIGAYWKISDELAYRFAIKLYEGLFRGETIAKATYEARLSIKSEGDPTWLAYSVYADPFARITK